tara:strand:- start:219 stop:431 length:213 start_codon:yes stop_codon:yes gene_type:complete
MKRYTSLFLIDCAGASADVTSGAKYKYSVQTGDEVSAYKSTQVEEVKFMLNSDLKPNVISVVEIGHEGKM